MEMGIHSEISHLVFGTSTVVLGIVLLGTFIKVYRGYLRKWAEVPPTARRRGQITRAAFAGLATGVAMVLDGGAIALQWGSLTVLGWLALIIAIVSYAMLYPLSDERRFVDGPLRER